MSTIRHRFLGFSAIAGLLALSLTVVPAVQSADHGDTPLLIRLDRPDARLTDLHAFRRDDNLVIVLNSNPAIPVEVTNYVFSPDLTFEINIDRNSPVRFDHLDDLETFGGTVVQPNRIREDIVFKITFKKDGSPHLQIRGLSHRQQRDVQLFTGLRDDPFIRGNRIGKNVASIVLEAPLRHIRKQQSTLLLWATANAHDIQGLQVEHVGRALRSMFEENDKMNTLHPKWHQRVLGVQPDVMIFDTDLPAAFPNGRVLTDDVVNLVGDPRVLANDHPCPIENDVPFLIEFPYLAPPNPPDMQIPPPPTPSPPPCPAN